MQAGPRGTVPEEDPQDPDGGDNEPVTNVRTALERFRAPVREAVLDAGARTGPPLRLSRRARQFDVLVALVIGVSTVYYGIDNVDNVVLREIAPGVEVAVPRPSGTGGLALMVTLAAVASGALALRRRHPLAVLCVVTAATLATPQSVLRLTFYAFVVAVYSAAVYSPYRAATLAALPVSVALVGTAGNSVTPIVPNEYIALLILVPMAGAAVGLRTWKLRTDEGRTRLLALEREQAEALRGAVEHERARIARELHDVVTHHVSVMIIQAGAARTIMERSPGQAGEALLAVEAGGRAAMTELRHVMGLLTMDAEGGRTDGAEAGEELSPQPGLDQLGTLGSDGFRGPGTGEDPAGGLQSVHPGGTPLPGEPRVVILTTFDLDRYVYAALSAGASGFLLKDVTPEHLASAVRTVRTGDALLAPAITRRLVQRFARHGGDTADLHRDLASLTPRELEVLGLLARGLSNAELAARLHLAETTVKTHVARVLAKLGLRDRVQAVIVAYETGLVGVGGPREAPESA
ncbi:LuxR C-terminal-related transcriptional regulator [[Kitasatospora] papulosa]|nr:LuxR C-terminal-related transcriptional regulator [[Kitasatospora] papulosa]WSI20592.1 LuxR C-terminal-related transcriptional regulator [[Kitasatospora] papulosa]